MKVLKISKFNFLLIYFSLIISLFLIKNSFAATTYYVDKDCVHGCSACSDSASGTSWATAFCTIQKAASVVNPGDTVIVANGTYLDHNSDGVVAYLTRGGSQGNWVTFKSENKWGAVIDGQNNTASHGFIISNGASYIRIEDFEFKNLKDVAYLIDNNSSNIYIYRNKIHDIGKRSIPCTDSGFDVGHAGIYSRHLTSYITVDSCLFHDIGRLAGGACAGNPSPCQYGSCPDVWYFDYNHDHALYMNGTNHTIINSIFYNNTAGWNIHPSWDGDVHPSNWKIINNTIYGRNGDPTGERWQHILIQGNNSNMIIENNISYGAGRSFIKDSGTGDTNCVARNNLVYEASNGLAEYSSMCNTWTCSGNIIGQDPKFVDLANKDFHLQGSSPAIDKGLSFSGRTVDADGNLIVGVPDIGAYEYVGTLPDTTPPAPPRGVRVE